MERLFVYGTLADPKVQMRVFGRVISGVPSVVEGYQTRIYIRYKMAIPAEGRLEGLVLNVTDAELARADVYEGLAYQRVRVSLLDGDAWMYAANPDYIDF